MAAAPSDQRPTSRRGREEAFPVALFKNKSLIGVTVTNTFEDFQNISILYILAIMCVCPTHIMTEIKSEHHDRGFLFFGFFFSIHQLLSSM